MDFKGLKERLNKLDAACIFDSNKNLRVMDSEIQPVNLGVKMIGIARTVHCKADFLTVMKALSDAKEDEVLVIDGEGDRIALAGELFTAEAQRKKLAGIVIDGGCRDVKQIRKTDFPVFARYITPKPGTSSKIFNTQIKINCGGISVSPGDIIFGDDDGIIVISGKESIEILEIAESIQQTEEKVAMRLKDGESLIDLMNFSEHYEKINKNQESKLTFTV